MPQKLIMSNVADRIFETLRAHGMTRMFGNPGSTELPLLARFPDDFTYVLGLQEATVTAMAMGYALSSDNAAVVNLHTTAGVGNAMGMITNAWHAQAPLLITAGQQDRRMIRTEPFLWGRQVQFVQPYVKWSVEPHRAVDVPEAIERGYHLAMTEPRGPVFISIPMDGLDHECPPVVPREVSYRTAPDAEAIARAAAVLQRGSRIAIVAGEQAEAALATDDLVALAERLQAAVFLAPEAYRHSFPEDHPLYQGPLPPAMKPLANRLSPYDTVLVVGAPVFLYYPYVPGAPVKPGTEVVQLTNDPSMASRALVGSSIIGNVALGLRMLLDLVKAGSRAAPPRWDLPAMSPPAVPLKPGFVFGELAKVLPAHAILCAEAPSWHQFLFEQVRLHDPRSFLATASGTLGFALPAAVGAAIARPDRPVVAILGDGSVHYTVQGLWTAARYGVPVTFVILNNHEYAILKSFERFLHLEGAPGLDVPGVDFEGLARGYGLPYRHITAPDEVGPRLAEAFASGVPNVVELEIDPFIPKLL
jgi:benzoylformate decarboxylase